MSTDVVQDNKHRAYFGFPVGAWVFSWLTASAYIMGKGYHDGYMSELGFNYQLYSMPVQDYWSYAIFATIAFILEWINKLSSNRWLVAFIVIIPLVGFFVVRAYKKNDQCSRRKSSRKLFLSNKKVGHFVSMASWPAFSIFISFSFPIFIAFILLLPGAIGESMGAGVAKEDMKIFSKDCNDPLRERFCTNVKEDDVVIMRGDVVAASSGYVALIVNGKSISMPVDGKTFESEQQR